MGFGLVGVAAQTASSPSQKVTAEQATFFETKIRPVLAENCLPCHGKTTQLSGLRLDTLAGLMKGGASGRCVVLGDPNKSLLIQAVRQTGKLKMPQGGKLKPAEVADLEAWVKMGAPWPESSKAMGDTLWSLQPVKKPALPVVRNKAWVRNPIDAFVLAGLEAKRLAPAPEADRRALLRRVTYDLTGLPPTAADVAAFVGDKSPGAYEKVVDRLLSSPRYGERWGREWLDVARYADTKGYVFEEDRNYPNAYTYRDWVIRSINEDLPYNQFIIDQLAADRLSSVINGDDKRPLAALGFLTVGRRFLNQQPDIIDDRIDVTMRGLEGFTVACARCHDHKFDPIPTQDYYSLYAIFASSQEIAEPISEKSIREPWEQFNKQVTECENGINEIADTQTKLLRKKDRKSLPADVDQVLQSIREETIPTGDSLTKLSSAFEPAKRAELASLQNRLTQLQKSPPRTPEFAMAMVDKPNPSDGVIFKRGNPANPGEAAPRRFLACLSKPERPHWTGDSGRLELAEAIASKDNPLTARVFVNRVWQGHFGAGIVRTPSDFGHQGEKPTDPTLLDYLASTFMENGWSMKKLHRLIVTSATYRQSSEASAAKINADPDNRLWGRANRQRLDLEEMRDSLTAVAGSLDCAKVGGKSVDLWSEPFTNRRAVYGFIERQNLPGIFKTFDFATPDSTSAKRFVTTVPQQALFFMNSPLVIERAKEVADRPEIKGAQDDGQRIRRLYQVLFQRLPDKEETMLGLQYLGSHALTPTERPRGPWSYGYGSLDAAGKRVTSFTPFLDFSESGYHVSSQFPDPQLGYLILNKTGGHPGHDSAHSVIRRWTAPAAMKIAIEGELAHGQDQGDGVRGLIVSSRSGVLGQWKVHKGSAPTQVSSGAVQKGDTIDFVVDPMGSDSFDSFSWAPKIRALDGSSSWDASTNFGPPPGAPLSRLALYIQALLMTNEFMFLD